VSRRITIAASIPPGLIAANLAKAGSCYSFRKCMCVEIYYHKKTSVKNMFYDNTIYLKKQYIII
jgi:hypothetical protein